MEFSKNYYAILGLKSPMLGSRKIKAQELKEAYRKKLLEAHPDKTARRDKEKDDLAVKQISKEGYKTDPIANNPPQALSNRNGTDTTCPTLFTVDDIKEAYNSLSSSKKPAYDRWLQARFNEGVMKYGSANLDWQAAFAKGILPCAYSYHLGAQNHHVTAEFLAGLELLDLSDFDVIELKPEDMGVPISPVGSPPASVFEMGLGVWEEKAEWRRPCRCGSETGFRITEEELEGAETRGEREVVVGCWGCSLNVRVGFDVEQAEDVGAGEKNMGPKLS